MIFPLLAPGPVSVWSSPMLLSGQSEARFIIHGVNDNFFSESAASLLTVQGTHLDSYIRYLLGVRCLWRFSFQK
ncbi:hypothetical protein B0H66DRAFT_161117 [Apodospora peruviana]|uniref:Uncharacterized protein n=1 Tax=Apodospora peruviana TaxID=516989 RepID=A0AAE0MCZ3_9PEZI|nr:hypothetical protein B0H66DRAFT_161117 [Apodospora peruviana]